MSASFKANATAQILARVYAKCREYQNIIDKFLTKSIKLHHWQRATLPLLPATLTVKLKLAILQRVLLLP